MNNKVIMAVLVIVFAAGGFYGGTIYQKSKAPGQRMGQGNFMARGGNNSSLEGGQQQKGQGMRPDGQRGGGGNFLAGEIISKDDKSVTIKTQDGGSKIVYFSDTTSIGKTVDGGAGDLASGQQVMVSGKNNSDGSLAAENIQIKPSQPE